MAVERKIQSREEGGDFAINKMTKADHRLDKRNEAGGVR